MTTQLSQASWPLQDVLVLRGIKKLTSRKALETMQRFGTLDEAWHHPHGLGAAPSLELFGESLRSLRSQAADIQQECEEHGYSIVPYASQCYPLLLKEISSPPLVLFALGQLPPPDFLGCGIIGTRACTDYGRRVCEWFSEECVRNDVVVVSGLANGIDAYAHAKTVASGGKTIAVIASGLAQISPWQSAELAKNIAESGGCVLSEYRPGTKALPVFFPQRNRIISGLSKAVVVVESKRKGGSLITAKFALDQNREVCAVPGSIYSSRSAGTNELIRKNIATCVSSPAQLFELLGIDKEHKGETLELSQDHARIVSQLESGPKHLEEIIAAMGVHVHVLQPALLDLELRGIIQRDSAMRFTLLKSI